MNTITLQHPDGTEQTFQAPSEFRELSAAEFVGAVATLRLAETQPEAQWQLLLLLLKIPAKLIDQLDEVQRVQLLATLNFLSDPAKLPYQWLIPRLSAEEFRHQVFGTALTAPAAEYRQVLHGPGDGLKFLTFGEFMHVEQRYELYLKLPYNLPGPQTKEKALGELCGILHREAHPARHEHDDPRLPFEKSLIGAYGKPFRLVSEACKQALLLNYHGAKAQFPRLYKHVFPAKLQENEGQKKKKPGSQALTWLNTAVQMSQRDVTKIATIEASPLHLVLKVLDDTIAADKELREEYERMRRS